MPLKTKILLLITNLGAGGAQRVFYDHCVFLSKQYNVSEAVFDKNESPALFTTGNPLYSLKVEKGNGFKKKISNFLKRGTNLKKVVDKESISVCISHMDGANWVNVLSRSKAKKILVVHGTILHDYAVNKWLQLIRTKFLIPYLYNKADVTVAVSEGIKYELEQFCGVKNAVAIPNFFDIGAIKEKAIIELPANEQKLFTDYKVLITSGRFHEQKKQHFLFPVYKQIKQTHPNTKLVLLGDGELREDLIKSAQEQGLTTYSIWNQHQPFSNEYDVYFLGYKENPFQYLSKSILFVFPSGWEGFPMALCEAIICGVPVLSADCPTGPREILAPGTFDAGYTLNKAEVTKYGVLLPMANKTGAKSAWINAIENLLSNPGLQLQLVKKSQDRIKEFEKVVVEEKWFTLIEKVLHH